MAFAAGVAPRRVRGVFSRMNAEVPEAIPMVIGDERLLPAERDLIREEVLPVVEEHRVFIDDPRKGQAINRQRTADATRSGFLGDRSVGSTFIPGFIKHYRD